MQLAKYLAFVLVCGGGITEGATTNQNVSQNLFGANFLHALFELGVLVSKHSVRYEKTEFQLIRSQQWLLLTVMNVIPETPALREAMSWGKMTDEVPLYDAMSWGVAIKRLTAAVKEDQGIWASE